MNRISVFFSHMRNILENFRDIVTFTDFRRWRRDQFASPSPVEIKIATLRRFGSDEYWIESGTYLGDTTMELAKGSVEVHTIEPSLDLFSRSGSRLVGFRNVFRYNSLSETIMGEIIDDILYRNPDASISFYLDAHYSHNDTHRGPIDNPILLELEQISLRLNRIKDFVILIDDARLFSGIYQAQEDYPPLKSLVEWAILQGLRWTIEHDMFIVVSN